MKKNSYMAPETRVSSLEALNMLAASISCVKDAADESTVLSNQDVWGDGLW